MSLGIFSVANGYYEFPFKILNRITLSFVYFIDHCAVS